MAKAKLFDSSKCIGCRGCQAACKQWWELPAVVTTNRGSYENPPDLGPGTWNKIRFREVTVDSQTQWLFTRQSCMHCTDAVCVWVCPTYARSYHTSGAVIVDLERCIGCGRCGEYCPFEVPKLGVHNISPRIKIESYTPRQVSYKCGFCEDRLDNGLEPACVKTCPPGALQSGDREAMVKLGQARVSALKTRYPKAVLYGERELGGLHTLYVLTNEPYVHGLPESPKVGTYPGFDADSYPDWYIRSLSEGGFPVFPSDAKRSWYMEPDLVPASGVRPPREAQKQDFWKQHAALSWGWLAVGVVGTGAALLWVTRRKNQKSAGKDEHVRKP